ncbi:MAG: imelysin family protein [Candidatus Competibacteraceae bacterium]|jgi:predicted lipoprotein|nr:imelysin family protein [Candidatus Competibacteraceae bacterium]
MRRHFHQLIAGFISGVALLCPMIVCADDTETLLRTADHYIIPAYQLLAESTGQLQDQAQAFCETPSDQTLQSLRAAFNDAMDDWQSIQHIRFGPVEFLLRGPRFQLWPDKRGSVGKHLARLLESADPAALEPRRFARGSVAVQGFSALERLLFSQQTSIKQFDTSDAGRFRCAVLVTIAHNLAHMAGGIVSDWNNNVDAFRQVFASAATGNAYYENSREPLSNLLNNLHTQLQFIVEQKLDRPLGSSVARANGRRAESWRSSRSLRNIQLNLQSLQSLYQVTFVGGITDPELTSRIADSFDQASQRLTQIPTPLHEAVTKPEARQTVMDLRTQISQLQGLFAGPVPQALDLSLGFNSLDGD